MTATIETRATPAAIATTIRAAVLTAPHVPDGGDRWLQAVHAVVRALIHRVASARDLGEPELPYTRVESAESALDGIGPLTGWTPLDIGDIHQRLLPLQLVETNGAWQAVPQKGTTTRDLQGSWYTPAPLARETTRLALAAALSLIPVDDPDQVLRLRAVDPACGAGVFLVEGTRMIAAEYARRLAGTPEPPPHLVRKITPQVIYQCVYGMDIDPVAVDLARMSLWLEADGVPGFGWLDGNVACVNPLAGPSSLPARLLDVMGELPPHITAA